MKLKKILSNTWVVGIISGIIAAPLNRLIGSIGAVKMETLYQMFVVQIWPIWFGLSVAGIYRFVRFLLRLNKFKNNIDKLNIENLKTDITTQLETTKKELKVFIVKNIESTNENFINLTKAVTTRIESVETTIKKNENNISNLRTDLASTDKRLQDFHIRLLKLKV